MRVLVPVDGSDCSRRALRFAAEFAGNFDADLRVVHITDAETDATEEILRRAKETLAEEGLDVEPEVDIDVGLTFRSSNRVGNDILDLVEEDGYDHVVMGHRGAGAVERAILGSAARTVVEANTVPVTIIS